MCVCAFVCLYVLMHVLVLYSWDCNAKVWVIHLVVKVVLHSTSHVWRQVIFLTAAGMFYTAMQRLIKREGNEMEETVEELTAQINEKRTVQKTNQKRGTY